MTLNTVFSVPIKSYFKISSIRVPFWDPWDVASASGSVRRLFQWTKCPFVQKKKKKNRKKKEGLARGKWVVFITNKSGLTSVFRLREKGSVSTEMH
jgi:hypothetical protein